MHTSEPDFITIIARKRLLNVGNFNLILDQIRSAAGIVRFVKWNSILFAKQTSPLILNPASDNSWMVGKQGIRLHCIFYFGNIHPSSIHRKWRGFHGNQRELNNASCLSPNIAEGTIVRTMWFIVSASHTSIVLWRRWVALLFQTLHGLWLPSSYRGSSCSSCLGVASGCWHLVP